MIQRKPAELEKPSGAWDEACAGRSLRLQLFPHSLTFPHSDSTLNQSEFRKFENKNQNNHNTQS